jgi:pyruvate, orthophosphate dikinase
MSVTETWQRQFTRPLDSGIERVPVVGGRGAALSVMHSLGLSVPPCFAITVDAFRAWRSAGGATPPDVWREVGSRLVELSRGLGGNDSTRVCSLAVLASSPDRPPELPTGFGAHIPRGIEPVLVARSAVEAANEVRRAIEVLWRRQAEAAGQHGDVDREIAIVVQHDISPGTVGLSGHGLVVSRDPATGSPGAVVYFTASVRRDHVPPYTDEAVAVVARHELPEVYDALEDAVVLLESVFGDMCAIRFVVDGGELWLVDAFLPQRSGPAAIRVAVDMIDDALVGVQDGLRQIPLWALGQAQAPVFARQQALEVVSRAQPVAPGAGVGAAVFDMHGARERDAGDPVVLVVSAAAADEAVAQWAPSGVLLAGPSPRPLLPGAFAKRPAVCHAPDLVIDPGGRQARTASGRVFHADEVISVDGRRGLVAAGTARLVPPQPEAHVARVLRWCEDLCRTTIAEVAPSGWHRVGTAEAAGSVPDGARVLIDLSVKHDPSAWTAQLRQIVAAALKAGATEVGLVLPSLLCGWDPDPPAATWRLTVAPPRLTWAARLFGARVRLDGEATDPSQLTRIDEARRARLALRLRVRASGL